MAGVNGKETNLGRSSNTREIAIDPTLPRLRNYLGFSIWQRDKYPSGFLVLSARETAALSQDGHSVHFAHDQDVNSTLAIARAKQELQDTKTTEISELSELAQSYLLLNSVSGHRWQNGNTRSIIGLGLKELLENTTYYDRNLPSSWRKQPKILQLPIWTAKERIKHLNKRVPTWRSGGPNIILFRSKTVDHRVDYLNERFGASWTFFPAILTTSPKNVMVSERALATIGISLQNTKPYDYFMLLSTSMEMKRRKTQLIRAKELGHKFVRVDGGKTTKDEHARVEGRHLTEEERAREKQEIREFVKYIRKKPKLLIRRLDKIGAEDPLSKLVRAAKTGDKEASEKLVRATYRNVYSHATRLVGEADAEEVTQEVFFRVLKSLDGFREDSPFSSWVHTITRNCASSYLATRQKHQHEEISEEVNKTFIDEQDESDPLKMAVVTDLRRRANAALTKPLRDVFVLRDVYDLQHDAIATELGITESAARVRLTRARQKLRDELFQPETDGETTIFPDQE